MDMKEFTCALAVMAVLLLAFSLRKNSQYKSEVEHLRREVGTMSDALQAQAQRATSDASAARELAAEVAQLRVDALRTASAASPRSAMPARQDDPAESRPEVSPRVIGPEEVTQHIETTFHSEAMDTAWAREARQQLQEKLATILSKGASIGSLECHSSLCRIELRHPDEEQYRQFMQNMTQDGTFWKGASMTYRGEEDGRNIVTISYLTREGHAMPFPETARSTHP